MLGLKNKKTGQLFKVIGQAGVNYQTVDAENNPYLITGPLKKRYYDEVELPDGQAPDETPIQEVTQNVEVIKEEVKQEVTSPVTTKIGEQLIQEDVKKTLSVIKVHPSSVNKDSLVILDSPLVIDEIGYIDYLKKELVYTEALIKQSDKTYTLGTIHQLNPIKNRYYPVSSFYYENGKITDALKLVQRKGVKTASTLLAPILNMSEQDIERIISTSRDLKIYQKAE